jgi:hypothetical protein
MARDRPLTPQQHARLERLSQDIDAFKPRPSDVAAVVIDLLALAPREVSRAESLIRGLPGRGWWRRPQPTILSRLLGRPGDLQTLLKRTPGLEHILVFEGDGRVRAAALRKMDGPCRTAFDAAVVLYRLNDWAAPVRRVAAHCAARRFPNTPPAILAESLLGLADRQHLRARASDHGAVLATLMDRPEIRRAMSMRIAGMTDGAVSAPMDQMARNPTFDAELEAWARSARLPQVRARALKALVEGEVRWHAGHLKPQWVRENRRIKPFETRPLTVTVDRQALLLDATTDRSPLVRRTASTVLVRYRNELPNWRELAERLRSDANPSVRERAEWVIQDMARAHPSG